MGRLIIVANRLPISISRRDGRFRVNPSPGGLAAALASLPDSLRRVWVGWPGISAESLTDQNREQIRRELADTDCVPVHLSQQQVDEYYLGFCNKTIWPLFHYFLVRTTFVQNHWAAYRHVNTLFLDELVKIIEPGDSVWVHDFQLMLLPQMLRERHPDLHIGYFLHIPWPSSELYRLLPWREEILQGLLGADLIGFHTYDYVRHFLSSAARICGLEHSMGEIAVHERIVKVDAFPLGVDFEKHANASHNREVRGEIDKIRNTVGNRKIILSIDRLDYTKGIVERLEAFDWFLSTWPQYEGKVTLIIVAVPSRIGIEDYQLLRERLEQLVSRVNGEHGAMEYMPVWYLYRSMPFKTLSALYAVADVCLVTPLRDGMNLIAKEFVATKSDGRGVLILSEMTGAARELGEALVINVNDKEAVGRAIKEALEMPESEQIERNRLMQERLRRYDVARWANDFIHSLADIAAKQQRMASHRLSKDEIETLCGRYAAGERRLLMLDYDGTLVGFRSRPGQAGPDPEIVELLAALIADRGNHVAVVSGRDRDTLDRWLGEMDMSIVAEHGGWIRRQGQGWQSSQPLNEVWKRAIRPILELYCDRTPGSLVEEKDFSLVWHYRRADPTLATIRMQELRGALASLTENIDVGIFEGNKILEIRRYGISKARAVESLMAAESWDFLLAVGDDYTDEEMFAALPENAWSIKVGPGASKARFNVDSVRDVRQLLRRLGSLSSRASPSRPSPSQIG
ncbi:MAG: bifunctional alpha,alpha-trehalose-phosphate synthase (UDP-forming)/trehalose-phosphatase [Planctomycetes bacterium]|nr:bifunctional alpha,alpha-trehalose-phosphate synthase (UDP-forming)/trehalose-phosphatase [Planctomycetota bacterium]